ncbi:MAG: hypothetical protein ACYTCU_04840 [Planctomycetota bacterium]|jgi:hypothetical protein
MRPLRVAAPILALLLSCSHDEGTHAPVMEADATAPSWPDPLPAHADDVPHVHKGLVVGTWAPDDTDGFDHQWVDEASLRKVFTMEKASRRGWRGFSASDATIPMDALLNDRSGPMIGYAYSLVSRSSEDGVFADEPAVMHVRHRGRVRVLLDGRVVVDEPASPDGDWRDVRAAVTLTDPYDVVLVKSGRGSDELGVSMNVQIRISAPDGSPLPGQTWNSMRPPGMPSDL